MKVVMLLGRWVLWEGVWVGLTRGRVQRYLIRPRQIAMQVLDSVHGEAGDRGANLGTVLRTLAMVGWWVLL